MRRSPRDMLDLAHHIVESKSGHFVPQKFDDGFGFALLGDERSGKPVIAATRFEVGAHAPEPAIAGPEGRVRQKVCVKGERRSRRLSRHRTARDRSKSRCPETARGVRRHGLCAGQPLHSPGHARSGRHGRPTAHRGIHLPVIRERLKPLWCSKRPVPIPQLCRFSGNVCRSLRLWSRCCRRPVDLSASSNGRPQCRLGEMAVRT
jgi:hypothetical protein